MAVEFAVGQTDGEALEAQLTVAHAQLKALVQAQAAGVEQAGGEPPFLGDRIEHGGDGLGRAHTWHAGGRVELAEAQPLQRDAQHLFIDKCQGETRLVQAARRHLPFGAEVAQEGADFGRAHQRRMAAAVEDQEAEIPVEVGGGGARVQGFGGAGGADGGLDLGEREGCGLRHTQGRRQEIVHVCKSVN